MRWKGFITLIVIFTAVIVFNLFFLNNVVEKTIEKGGTAVWGAKVEIGKLKISWSPLGMEIYGLTVASKKEEFKNLIDIGSVKFSVLTEPLFERKLVIKETIGEKLAFNTDRKTSGFISRAKKKKREDAEEKWKLKMDSWLEDIQKRGKESINVADAFKKEDLKSVKSVEEVTDYFNEMKEKYTKVEGLKVEDTIQLASEKIKELQKIKIEDADDVAQAAKIISEAQDAVVEVNNQAKQIQNVIADFNNDLSGLKGKYNLISLAKIEDVENILKMLELPSIAAYNISKIIFGPLIVDKFKTVITYVEKIRKYIPPKKKEEKTVKKPRKQGQDIIFIKEKTYPAFYLMRGYVSGENNASLDVRDLTDTPWVINKPAVIQATYADFKLKATIDRTKEAPAEIFSGSADNFNVAGMNGAANIKASFIGDEVDSFINWKGGNFLSAAWLSYLDMKDSLLDLSIRIYGQKDNLKYTIKSNLDQLMAARLKKELDQRIAEAKKKINDLIKAEVQPQIDKLMNEIDTFRDKNLKFLNLEKQKIEIKQNELNKLIDLKKKEQSDILKKKQTEAEEKLKKDTEKKLRKLFK